MHSPRHPHDTRSFGGRLATLAVTGREVLAWASTDAFRGSRGHVLIHCPSPDHEDRNPSCSVHPETGWARCFGCGWTAGDVVALHRVLSGFSSMGDALRDLEQRRSTAIPPLTVRRAPLRTRRTSSPAPRENAVVVAEWIYRSADGTPEFLVRRIQYRDPDGSWVMTDRDKPRKSFFQTHPDGTPGLPSRFDDELRSLYRLPELLAADADTVVYITEGEKAADALVSIGWCATTSSGGAGAAARTDWAPLAGRRVVIWPDHDTAGRGFSDKVSRILAALEPRPEVRRVDVKRLGLGRGGDAADWVSTRRSSR